MSERYARVVENAQVEVQIPSCGSEPVDLVGAFVTAGRYYLCDHFRTVGDAVRAAEGLTEQANVARDRVRRLEVDGEKLREESLAAVFSRATLR